MPKRKGWPLHAAEETRKSEPDDSRKLMQALELAGLSAQRQIHYARAMEHFREAEKFTDRARNLDDWVTVQHEIADLLIADGKMAMRKRCFAARSRRGRTLSGRSIPARSIAGTV